VLCHFCSDMHGSTSRYRKLFDAMLSERPCAVFLGGDLLPNALAAGEGPPDFVRDFLAVELGQVRERLAEAYPEIFVILGNDDLRAEEEAVLEAQASGLWQYVHGRRVDAPTFSVYGYSSVPPTPFHLKDWERYDVSRYVDPGCVSPEEGRRSVAHDERDVRYGTILADLAALVDEDDLESAVFLFHSPPYDTLLDRAALDGQMVDHVPLDVHVGSIAIRRFIEERQPLLTLHGHVHESARLTGEWRDRIGRTHLLSAAYDGPELALVRFDPEALGGATRELL
jgi:uncharacterized protein